MDKLEKVFIVGVQIKDRDNDIENSLDELEELIKAAKGIVEGRTYQKREKVDPAFFIGKGKAMEIKRFCNEKNIKTVVFNDELSGAQLRNLENLMGLKIIDRTNLILDIFALRASSKEGKLQVKLAQLQYRLPRLVGLRDYLSREGGGIGTRGPGEQKLETDRRHILKEINNIEKELKKLKATRDITRKRRNKSKLPVIALVGYTNSGKSTLLNRLSIHNDEGKKAFVKDMLFATLDTSLRRSKLMNGQEIIISDTVGFVSKLPTHLIEAFKGTLEEVQYADLLLHVVDASNKDLDIQIDTTMRILKELNVIDKPIITVFNKMDRVNIEDLVYNTKHVGKKVFISASKGLNIDKLLLTIEDALPYKFRYVRVCIPYDKQSIASYLMNKYEIDSLKHKEDGTYFNLTINSIDYKIIKKYIL